MTQPIKLYRHIVTTNFYRKFDHDTDCVICIFFTTSPDVVYQCTTDSTVGLCVPNYVMGNALHGNAFDRADNPLGQTKYFELGATDAIDITSVTDTVERLFSEAD